MNGRRPTRVVRVGNRIQPDQLAHHVPAVVGHGEEERRSVLHSLVIPCRFMPVLRRQRGSGPRQQTQNGNGAVLDAPCDSILLAALRQQRWTTGENIFHERIVTAHDGEVERIGLPPRPRQAFETNAVGLEHAEHLGVSEECGHASGGMERREVPNPPPRSNVPQKKGIYGESSEQAKSCHGAEQPIPSLVPFEGRRSLVGTVKKQRLLLGRKAEGSVVEEGGAHVIFSVCPCCRLIEVAPNYMYGRSYS